MRSYLLLVAALALVGCDDAMTRDAKQAVRNSQKDPGSVQFQAVTHCDGLDGVYGFYNAKNASGDYVGYKVFVYGNGRLLFHGDPGTDKLLDRCYTLSK